MRVDTNPTDTYGDFKIRPGLFLANGSNLVPGGVNFTIYSKGAKSVELVLYHSHEKDPFAVIPFPESYRIGDVFAMIVFDLDYENLEYGFRVDGEYDFQRGNGNVLNIKRGIRHHAQTPVAYHGTPERDNRVFAIAVFFDGNLSYEIYDLRNRFYFRENGPWKCCSFGRVT